MSGTRNSVWLFSLLAISWIAALPGVAWAAPQVGDTLNVRVDDEYYAYYTANGGTFAPLGNATVDAADPQLFHMPITFADPAAGSGQPTFRANGSGILMTMTLPGFSRIGDLSDWGSVNSDFDPLGIIMPTNTDTDEPNADAMHEDTLFAWLLLNLQGFSETPPYDPGSLVLFPGGYSPAGEPNRSSSNLFLDSAYGRGFPIAVSGDYAIIDTAISAYEAGEQWNFFEVTVVPEPACLSLLALAGSVALRRRRCRPANQLRRVR